MPSNPTDDILSWSAGLVPWRKDALRRLACSSTLPDSDREEIYALVKKKAGFTLATEPPPPDPLTKSHVSSALVGPPIELKKIQNIQHVNQLVPSASLKFLPGGLTLVYGLNGSGKSGFVRIFRTACRTRIENPAKLKILADVYSSSSGPQEADIIIDKGTGDESIHWTPALAASEDLLQVAVFDNSAAQLYIDSGNQIRFLPFGLALPHKLNELCLYLRERLELERNPVTKQIELAVVPFQHDRQTQANIFYNSLTSKTTDKAINKAASFSAADLQRQQMLTQLLSGGTFATDIDALANQVETLATDTSTLAAALSDETLGQADKLAKQAHEARNAANLKSDDLFSDEPLPGVGSDTWRSLWQAARDYSVAVAYPGQEFPVTSFDGDSAFCVLCQQDLTADGVARLNRFQDFMAGVLEENADAAELAVTNAIANLPQLGEFSDKNWLTRVEQLRSRDESIAEALVSFKAAAESRLIKLKTVLQGTADDDDVPPVLKSPESALKTLVEALRQEAKVLEQSESETKQAELQAELNELDDKKILGTCHDVLISRRDLLKIDALYVAALADLQTKGTTQKGNALIDKHLTSAVKSRFAVEQVALDITHLKISLSRISGKTKAAFETTPGTSVTKTSSDILSEGEQRALALAAFFTEIAVTEGSGPIIVDDPVSSLDRERGLKVASRLAEEAKERQVIVFTHDLVFFNDLCREADDRGVETYTEALFRDGNHAGRIDPAGMPWKGQPVQKRINILKNEFVSVRKLHATSPAEYEFSVKNLYGRLRDTYERVVEEVIFCDIVRRKVDNIETQKLRYIQLSDALAIRFHEGMTKANTHSHDNPASGTVPVPPPDEFDQDVEFVEKLIVDIRADQKLAESNRPSMKP